MKKSSFLISLFLLNSQCFALTPPSIVAVISYKSLSSEVKTGVIYIGEDSEARDFAKAKAEVINALSTEKYLDIYSTIEVYPSNSLNKFLPNGVLEFRDKIEIPSKNIELIEVIGVHSDDGGSVITKLSAMDNSWADSESQKEIDNLSISTEAGGCSYQFYSHKKNVTGLEHVLELKNHIEKYNLGGDFSATERVVLDKFSELIGVLKSHKIVVTSFCSC